MSLINEALKKAQQDRPDQKPAPGGPMPPPRHQEKRKNRGFLWGFILALVIVGAVSSLLAAYLVLQLLDPESPEPEPPSPAIVQTMPEENKKVAQVASSQVVEAPPIPVPEEIKEEKPPTPPVAEVDSPPEPHTNPVTEIPPAEVVVEEAPVTTPSATVLPSLPNPDVVARLRELEIRGIMSGATKVLIHDMSTGKTRSYQVGESLQGTMGLNILRITSNSIQFKDYAGQTHTKSF